MILNIVLAYLSLEIVTMLWGHYLKPL